MLWDAYRDWEMEQLEAAGSEDNAERYVRCQHSQHLLEFVIVPIRYLIIDLLQEAYLARLKEPHSGKPPLSVSELYS